MWSARAAWERTARVYTALRNLGPFRLLRRAELRRAKRLLDEAPGKGVWVDLGCGDGAILGLAAWPGLRLGMDWSAGMMCRARLTGAKLVLADARALPLRAGVVGRLTAIGLEEYLREKSVLWAEIARALAGGGHAVVTVATPVPINLIRVALGKRIYLSDFFDTKKFWEREGLRVVKVENTLLQKVVLLRKV